MTFLKPSVNPQWPISVSYQMCHGLSWMLSKHNAWETFTEVMASCRSILFAKNSTGIFLQRMSKRAEGRRRASHAAGGGWTSQICCKAALNLHLRGWEEYLVPLWQQPSSVCRCCQWRIWRRGCLCGGQGKARSWAGAVPVAFNEPLISFILVIMLP